MPHLDQVLDPDVDEDQGPGQVEAAVVAVPVAPDTLPDEIEQVHVDEEEDVLPLAVAAVQIDIEGRIVPDLNDGQAAQGIGQKGGAADKAVFHILNQGIVAADDIYKDQVIDQFQVFYLFFFCHGGDSFTALSGIRLL